LAILATVRRSSSTIHQLGEAKWGRVSGLTLFLPHGYEGQGRNILRRAWSVFCSCAPNSHAVCVPSTPAQMFHLLRRQMLRRLRKPLIILTPKSLLRHPLSVSRLEELSANGFQTVIDEIDDVSASAVTRVVFCSGKSIRPAEIAARIEVADRRNRAGRTAVSVPTEEYEAILRKYENAREIIWCQEEPQNQGSWYQIRHRLQSKLEASMSCCTRAGREPPRRRLVLRPA